MGLEESVDETGEIFITEVYITSAGLKEQGAILEVSTAADFYKAFTYI
jgi:hypothetical protein